MGRKTRWAGASKKWGVGGSAAKPQRPNTAGAVPPPPTARASTAGNRLRRPPLRVEPTTTRPSPLPTQPPSRPYLQVCGPCETTPTHSRQGRAEGVRYNTWLTVSLSSRMQGRERALKTRWTPDHPTPPTPPAPTPPAPTSTDGAAAEAPRRHEKRGGQRAISSIGLDRPRTFFENPLPALRPREVVKVPGDRQFLHGHLRKVDRHDLQAVQRPPTASTRAEDRFIHTQGHRDGVAAIMVSARQRCGAHMTGTLQPSRHPRPSSPSRSDSLQRGPRT